MIERFLPCLGWLRRYDGTALRGDALAAVIVTIMLIPQSLAYALLAGLPPQVGLYASMLPLIGYALFGSSNALAVGPVAVVSLMTAAAVGQVAATGKPTTNAKGATRTADAALINAIVASRSPRSLSSAFHEACRSAATRTRLTTSGDMPFEPWVLLSQRQRVLSSKTGRLTIEFFGAAL